MDMRRCLEYLDEMREYLQELMRDMAEVASIPSDVYDDAMFLQSLSEEQLHQELQWRDEEMEEYLRCHCPAETTNVNPIGCNLHCMD